MHPVCSSERNGSRLAQLPVTCVVSRLYFLLVTYSLARTKGGVATNNSGRSRSTKGSVTGRASCGVTRHDHCRTTRPTVSIGS